MMTLTSQGHNYYETRLGKIIPTRSAHIFAWCVNYKQEIIISFVTLTYVFAQHAYFQIHMRGRSLD